MAGEIHYYGRRLQTWRASLHTHSNMSDGSFSPAEVIELYAKRGYDILAFTDHSVANPVSCYSPEGLTLVSGMEIHPMGPRGERWHLLALGVPEDFPDPVVSQETTMQECIDDVHAAGGVAFCAHPAYCGFRSSDLAPLQGLDGLEVFNSDCRFAGKGDSSHIWNELADDKMLLNAIAVDDMHTRRDLFGGWTMVLTDQPLSQKTVLQALRQGDFYATQGPEFHSLGFHDGVLEAEFSPCVEVIGISFRWRGYPAMCENLTGPDDGFQEVTRCRIAVKHDLPDAWIRLQIKDRQGHCAWSNPFRCN